MDAKRIEKFRKVVESCEDGIAILIAQVDPDAFGAGVLLRKALEFLGKRAEIYYAGKVSQLNQALFNIFEIEKIARPIPNEFPSEVALALVDSSMAEDKRFGSLGRIEPRIVIDHHRSDLRESEDTWVEIQQTGSASAIAADLLFSLGVPFNNDAQVTTLGALGISGDTDGFDAPETTSLDREMYYKLMEHGNQELVTAARRYDLPDRYFDIQKELRNSEHIGHATLVASGGFIAEKEKDFLARIANNLVRRTGVRLVVVWAVVDDTNLVVKARTTDKSSDLNEMLKRLFGSSYAGAKTGAGGAEIPLGFLAPSAKSREELLRFLDAKMRDAFHISE